MKVHEAVIANKEIESGITIHYINEEYDKGQIIFQAKCEVSTHDTSDSVAQKIHALEHEHFPKIIEQLLLDAQK
jgi:phosphoribosylglycinamide formyltransferase-1